MGRPKKVETEKVSASTQKSNEEQNTQTFVCSRCGAEYEPKASKCPECLAPTDWEN